MILSLIAAMALSAGDVPDKRVQLGSRLPRRVEKPVGLEDVRGTGAAVGQCIARHSPVQAAQIVLAGLDRDSTARMSRLLDDGCFLGAVAADYGEVQGQFPHAVLRFWIANGLVNREFSAGHSALIGDAAALPSIPVPDPGLEQFAECVVRAAPEESHALLLTRVESDAESAAIRTLSPRYPPCIMAGQKVALNKTTLRGSLAVAYYRLAHAPRVSQPATGAAR